MLEKLISRLRPDLDERSGLDRTAQVLNVYFFLYSIPLLLAGLVWLFLWTDWEIIRQNGVLLIVLLAVSILFRRFSFTLQFQIRPGVFASSGGSFSFLVAISAVLIFGPSAYWLSLISNTLNLINTIRRNRGRDARWAALSTTSIGIAGGLLSVLFGYWAYQALGGSTPLPDLTWPNLWPAIIFLLINWAATYPLTFPLIRYISKSPDLIGEDSITPSQFVLSLVISSSLPNLGLPFTLLGAVLYTQQGVGQFLFFLAAFLLASALSSRLSDNVLQRTNRAREMTTLEELGRAILVSEPNLQALTDQLGNHVSNMFVDGSHYIWLYPDNVLGASSQFDDPNIEEIKKTFESSSADFLPIQPYESARSGKRIGATIPIRTEDNTVIGGISFNLPADSENVEDYIPALQALAAQISSALYRYDAHQEALRNERMTSELEIAGRIQANLLPKSIPNLEGYQIAASITPARQTSGDFYDFIPFPDGRLGVLIADVADKGAGAALFMALSRTLIRSYAMEFPGEPEKVLQLANQRILEDTQDALFITGFYLVIDPKAHTITYVNAGHNPPYLLGTGEPQPLPRTGIPLGIFEEAEWENQTVSLSPGDSLTLFTDGITEAENAQHEEYGEDRLLKVLLENRGDSAEEIQARVLDSVNKFVAGAPQTDDLTIMVIKRVP